MNRSILVYVGCFSSTKQYALEMSNRVVLEAFDSKYEELHVMEFPNPACCGHPIRSIKPEMWLYLACRLLAIAEERGSDLLPICNGCYLSVKEAKTVIDSNPKYMAKINDLLKEEGLKYTGKTRVYHTIEYFHDVITPNRIRELVGERTVGTINVAAHYGCHALRPKHLPQFDNPKNPQKFENIIDAIGFKSIRDYPMKLECCGAPLMAPNPVLGLKVGGAKLSGALKSGADLMLTTCPYCLEMLDYRQESISSISEIEISMPVMYYQQILGLVLGFDPRDLGLNFNMSPVERILERFKK